MSNITIQDKDDPLGANQRRDLALYYRTRGQVHLAVWGTFTVDANGDPVAGSYVPSAAREFRYHADPRARYAWRDWNTNGGRTDHTTWTAAGPLHWTDYDGAEPYVDGDITFDGQQNPAVAVGVQLFGSAGQRTAATGATRYFHADLVGSVGLRSDSAGAAAGRITYTAFGEVVTRSSGTEDQRYAYCGEYGYESGLLALDGKPRSAPITLQHVGARWYQAGILRFVQRDPIGLRGGVNGYIYVNANPGNGIDPNGTDVVVVGGSMGHSGVIIEDPSRNGVWWRYDYTPVAIGNWWDQGVVWENKFVTGLQPGDDILRRISCSPEADAECLAEARRWKENPPYYCIPTRCCHSLTNEIVWRAQREREPPIVIHNGGRGGRSVLY